MSFDDEIIVESIEPPFVFCVVYISKMCRGLDLEGLDGTPPPKLAPDVNYHGGLHLGQNSGRSLP